MIGYTEFILSLIVLSVIFLLLSVVFAKSEANRKVLMTLNSYSSMTGAYVFYIRGHHINIVGAENAKINDKAILQAVKDGKNEVFNNNRLYKLNYRHSVNSIHGIVSISDTTYQDPSGALSVEYIQDVVENDISLIGTSSLFFIDVNGLKLNNDILGYDHGNELIKKTVLSITARGDDKVIRYGGDEFIFIANGVSSEATCRNIYNRIKKRSEELGISISIGYTFISNDGIYPAITRASQEMAKIKATESAEYRKAFLERYSNSIISEHDESHKKIVSEVCTGELGMDNCENKIYNIINYHNICDKTGKQFETLSKLFPDISEIVTDLTYKNTTAYRASKKVAYILGYEGL